MALIALVSVGCAAPLHVVAAGDLNLGPRSHDVLTPIASLLIGDLRFANLEGPLVADCVPTEAKLCGDSARVDELRGRIDVASTVNNHASDHGAAGNVSTTTALAHAGVIDLGERKMFTRRGQRITIISRFIAPHTPLPLLLIDEVRRTRGVVIVSLHWGERGLVLPSLEQKYFAHQLITAGALAVLGHGPHSVQPVERFRGGVIAYSLGNLAFDCDCVGDNAAESDSIVLDFVITPAHAVEHVRLTPIHAGMHGAPTTRAADAQLLKLLYEISEAMGIVVEEDRSGALLVSPARGD